MLSGVMLDALVLAVGVFDGAVLCRVVSAGSVLCCRVAPLPVHAFVMAGAFAVRGAVMAVNTPVVVMQAFAPVHVVELAVPVAALVPMMLTPQSRGDLRLGRCRQVVAATTAWHRRLPCR